MFVPYERLVYHVPYPPGEVKSRLREQVDWPYSTKKYRYEGFVDIKSFNIWRRIYYRDSGLPIIFGKVQPTGDGSTIQVLIRLHAAVLTILAIGTIGFLAFGLYATITHTLDGTLGWPAVAPFLMAAVWYSGVTIWFRFELGTAIEFLNEVFIGLTGHENDPAPWQIH